MYLILIKVKYIIIEMLNKNNGITILYNNYVYYNGIRTAELIKQSNYGRAIFGL